MDLRPHLGLRALALLTLTAAPALALAQTHKVDAPEKVTRAIGVYEWTGDLAKPAAARLIPVSLFIDSHMEDAGVYLARPVPFALQTGDVYSIERAGQPLGTLDIDFARNLTTRHGAASDDTLATAWYGYGRFITAQEEAKLAKLKPSAKPPVIVSSLDDNDDGPPRFVYRHPPNASTNSTDSTDSTNAKPTTTDSSSTPAADPNRPVLTRRNPSATGDSSSSTTSTTNPAPDDDPERPTLRHREPATDAKPKKEKPGGYVTGPNDSLNNDPDRPTMRRGVPEGQASTPQLSGLPPDLHQAVAVSDAANRDVHPFARAWESDRERDDTLAGIEQLAQPRVANYILTNKLTVAADALAAKPASTTMVPLSNEQLSGYTLSYGGLPTFIYTAEVPVTPGGPVYITMVVQRLPAGELQVALSSVTDAAHLDRTPWLRPVDVVDPDWSHRASLLFELRAQTSRQFALYRLVSAKAEQTFITGIIE